MVPEPVTTLAPALPRPHLLRQRWCDVAFLHWAVRPEAVARFFPPGVRPDVLDGWDLRGARAVPAGRHRNRPRPRRAVGGHVPRDQHPAVLGGCHRAPRRRLPEPGHRPRPGRGHGPHGVRDALPLGADAVARRRRRPLLHRPAAVAGGQCEQPGDGPAGEPDPPSTARWRPSTARWGLHIAHAGRTWYLPNTHETWPLRRADVLELDDCLVASVGLGDLSRRAPDHVAFSPGVAATFGLPVLATTPRRG